MIVHNGIVENYLSLREELIAEGIEFKSETDTETIAHLIEIFYSESNDLYSAVQRSLKMIKGAHGLVVMSTEEPDRLIAARLGNAGGVTLGIGDGGCIWQVMSRRSLDTRAGWFPGIGTGGGH